jgi:hypothetical protein
LLVPPLSPSAHEFAEKTRAKIDTLWEIAFSENSSIHARRCFFLSLQTPPRRISFAFDAPRHHFHCVLDTSRVGSFAPRRAIAAEPIIGMWGEAYGSITRKSRSFDNVHKYKSHLVARCQTQNFAA